MAGEKVATAADRANLWGVVRDAWFVYILRCGDGSLYTGVARDVAARIAQHSAGKGARYTRGRGPLQLCAKRRCDSHGDALRLELAIKRLPRAAKERLVPPRRLGTFARRFFASGASVSENARSKAEPLERVRAAAGR